MIITREKMTDRALGFVAEGKPYDKYDVAATVATEFVDDLICEFGFNIDPYIREDFRGVMKNLALNKINWIRVNRKAGAQDYADGMKDGNWPGSVEGE